MPNTLLMPSSNVSVNKIARYFKSISNYLNIREVIVCSVYRIYFRIYIYVILVTAVAIMYEALELRLSVNQQLLPRCSSINVIAKTFVRKMFRKALTVGEQHSS